MVTLKKLIWNGKRKVKEKTVFKDSECFEGKYHRDTADVVFLEPEPEQEDVSGAKENAESEKLLKKEVKALRKKRRELKKELADKAASIKIDVDVPIPLKKGSPENQPSEGA